MFILSTADNLIINQNAETAEQSIIDKVLAIPDFVGKISWFKTLGLILIGGLIIFFYILRSLESYNKESKQLLKNYEDKLKYIPGLFVELNESKEVLRYFIHGKKWLKRIKREFNMLYESSVGMLYKNGIKVKSCEPSFLLNGVAGKKAVETVISKCMLFHEKIGKEKKFFEMKDEYKKQEYDLIRSNYMFVDKLDQLSKYINAVNHKYIILTGSAGNGKTTLLCNIANLIIKENQYVLMLDACAIGSEDLLDYIVKKSIKTNYPKKRIVYLAFLLINSIRLLVKRKKLFIIIDAVNENADEEFGKKIKCFCKSVLRWPGMRVLISCRSEYYEARFRDELYYDGAFEFELKEGRYTEVALARLEKNYRQFFNFTGAISPIVLKTLCNQLLLFRLFFEVMKNKHENVGTIRKVELFLKYLQLQEEKYGRSVDGLIQEIVHIMININDFTFVDINMLDDKYQTMIKDLSDGTILLSKKTIQDKGDITQRTLEGVYFVFDELRDFFIARTVLLDSRSSNGLINKYKILKYIRRLERISAPCLEGVICYSYLLARERKQNAICSDLLSFLARKIGPHNWQFKRSHEQEYLDMGMRIIMNSGYKINDEEKKYIIQKLNKVPDEDGSLLLKTFVDDAVYVGSNIMADFLDIIFGLNDVDTLRHVINVIAAEPESSNMFTYIFKCLNDQKEVISEQVKFELYMIAYLMIVILKNNNRLDWVDDSVVDFFQNNTHSDKIRTELRYRLAQRGWLANGK